MNKVILMGRLVSDPVMKQTGETTRTIFTIATDGFKDGDSDFHNITAWNKTAEFVDKYFSKGQRILLEGRNRSGKYEKDGETKYTYDVVAERVEFASDKKEKNSNNEVNENQNKQLDNIILEDKKEETEFTPPWELDL